MRRPVRVLVLVAALAGGSAFDAVAQAAPSKAEYRTIAAGSVRPMFVAGVPDGGIPVAAFLLAARPVTNAEYLRFVISNPEWRRSRISRVAADSSYLRHWSGDTRLGPGALSNAPVVNVSWFAARTYADWVGGRLPSTMEWELAGSRFRKAFGADPERLNAQVLAWYGAAFTAPREVGRGVVSDDGVVDLHGSIWEWVDDFNSSLVSGEGRAGGSLNRDLFCGSGAMAGGNKENYAAFMRFAFRSSLKAASSVWNLGFRCVKGGPG